MAGGSEQREPEGVVILNEALLALKFTEQKLYRSVYFEFTSSKTLAFLILSRLIICTTH